jgi:hypothetical protein
MDTILSEYILAWTSSFVIIETIANTALWWSSKKTNNTINEYYTKVPVATVVFGDFFYSTIIFLTALRLHKIIAKNTTVAIKDWRLFLVIFIATQWTLDLTWAFVVNTLNANGISNKYLDFFNRYAAEVGLKAVIGDTVYGLCWLVLFAIMLIKTDDLSKYTLIVSGLFLLVILSFS